MENGITMLWIDINNNVLVNLFILFYTPTMMPLVT
jgi:hypothetical protein